MRMTNYRRLLGLALVTLTAASLVACGKKDGAGSPTIGAGTEVTASAQATPAPSTAPSGAAPSIAASPAGYPATAQAYATAAVTAWAQRDSGRLAQLNAAGNPVFGTLSAGDFNRAFHLYRCDGAAGSSMCTFYNEVGDSLALRLQNALLGQAHAVVDGQWRPITFPEDLQAYARLALAAWTGHNTAAVALYTGTSGDSAFASVPAARRADGWTFDHDEGATGHLYYAFTNSAGDAVVLSFVNPGFASTPANRHGLVQKVIYQPHA
jgi:hypothetical protein